VGGSNPPRAIRRCYRGKSRQDHTSPNQIYRFQTSLGCQEVKMSAVKDDKEKPRYDLIPPEAMETLAEVLTYGAKKYEPHNWRKGFEWSRLYAALLRHLGAFWGGEDTDPESGLPHLSHALACVVFLSVHQTNSLGTDDRYVSCETCLCCEKQGVQYLDVLKTNPSWHCACDCHENTETPEDRYFRILEWMRSK